MAVAIFYLQRATYSYTAQLKVTAAQGNTAGGSKLGGLATLASVAGLSAPQDPGALSFQLYTEGLKSRTVAEALARRPDIMQVIFAPEWDAAAGRFVEPTTFVGDLSRGAKRLFGLPVYAWHAPDAARLQAIIEQSVSVDQNLESPVTTISFSHPDPRFAVKFLTALHEAVDDELRRKARNRSGEYIAYLSRQLAGVSIAEHRVALAQALSDQEKTRMMASSTMSFAAEPFGPATASLRPTKPAPMLVLATGLVMGVFLGIVAAFVRIQWTARSRVEHSSRQAAA
jgi:uncharacterized protein involved in exopolysaccharide biosynthesis